MAFFAAAAAAAVVAAAAAAGGRLAGFLLRRRNAMPVPSPPPPVFSFSGGRVGICVVLPPPASEPTVAASTVSVSARPFVSSTGSAAPRPFYLEERLAYEELLISKSKEERRVGICVVLPPPAGEPAVAASTVSVSARPSVSSTGSAAARPFCLKGRSDIEKLLISKIKKERELLGMAPVWNYNYNDLLSKFKEERRRELEDLRQKAAVSKWREVGNKAMWVETRNIDEMDQQLEMHQQEHSVVEEPHCLTLQSRKSSLELKELRMESKSITSGIPLQQSVDTLLPIMEKTMATGAPFEVELKSPLNVAKKASDNVRSQLQESNDSERLCMVLFDSVMESEEEAIDLIKKNVGLNRLSLTEWKEQGEESKSVCSDVQMQPKLEENKVTENTYFSGKMPFEKDNQRSLGSVKKANSSNLLFRRRKSLDPLRVPAGDVGSEMQHGTSPVCKKLFDSIEGENEGTFDSVKENVNLSSSLMATVLSSDEVNRVPGALEGKCTDILMPMPLVFVKKEAEEASPYQNKENLTPNYSSGRKPKKSILRLQRSPSNGLALLNGGEVSVNRNEEPFANSYKDNFTPSSSSGRKLKKNFLMSQRSASNDLSVLTEKRQMFSPDIFTPNKENLTPEVSGSTRTVKSLSKSNDRVLREVISKRVERVPFQCLLENSPSGNNDTFDVALYAPADQAICSPNCMDISKKEDAASGSNKANLTPKDSSSQKSKQCSSNCPDGIQREEKMKKGAERVPFQSFIKYSAPRNHNVHNSSNQHTAQVVNKVGEEEKTWNIVVDASCLLDDQSRRSLELLEGLKGTHLIIPNIVIKELDCMKRRKGLFARTRKASLALSWIEVCMVRSSWWIHVQSSCEMMPVAATPPAFPSVQLINGSNAAPSSSKSFSCGSLLEIVSPTAEDHILDCTCLFKELRNDKQIVLLTHSVKFKIKALAKGLICETPNEFRESLVNPYSKRFLWVNSRPRGRTWSTSDEQMAPDENYYHHFQVARKVAKPAEGAKGLKIILPRDFHCVKTDLV